MTETLGTFISNMCFTMHQINWACVEVERQQEGPMEVEQMLTGLGYASLFAPHTLFEHNHILNMNAFVHGGWGYRQVNVSFRQGTSKAVDWQHVERQMNLLLENQQHMNTDEFVHRFLEIHPFVDGNGRTAALLYNIKNGTCDEPVPLPDYFGG